MTVIDYRYIQCIQIRDTLNLSIAEAAKYIANTSPDEWLNWESNKEPVPESILDKINKLTTQITRSTLFVDGFNKSSWLNSYGSFSSYQHDHPSADFLDWKIMLVAVKSSI